MFRNLTVLICLISFSPVAAGAQELAVLAAATQPAVEQPAKDGAGRAVDLSLPVQKEAPPPLLAANDRQAGEPADAPRPHKTHTGLTFREFVDVHFGEYRWIYWVGAVTGIVLLHVLAFNHH